jgi:hypothetical protein
LYRAVSVSILGHTHQHDSEEDVDEEENKHENKHNDENTRGKLSPLVYFLCAENEHTK